MTIAPSAATVIPTVFITVNFSNLILHDIAVAMIGIAGCKIAYRFGEIYCSDIILPTTFMKQQKPTKMNLLCPVQDKRIL